MRSWMLGIVVVAWAGCGGDGKGGDSDTADGVQETDADTDTDTVGGTDTDTDTDPTTPVTGCYDVPITVEGGYGAIGYAPLADGDVVELTHGAQGGWHIETAVRADHINDLASILTHVTVVSTGQVISGFQEMTDANLKLVQLVPTGECAGESWGVRAFLNDFTPSAEGDSGVASFETDICALKDQEVVIDWSVVDLEELPEDARPPGTDSVKVRIAMDPADPACP